MSVCSTCRGYGVARGGHCWACNGSGSEPVEQDTSPVQAAAGEGEREAVAILKGIGKIDGDGWKDTTTKGEVVYVWNAEKPSPYAPGQYPRIGNEGWSASTSQYDFTPATADDVPAIIALLRPDAPDAGGGEPSDEMFGVSGATDEVEALAYAIWAHRCPGLLMDEDEDRPHYMDAARAAFSALDGPALQPGGER